MVSALIALVLLAIAIILAVLLISNRKPTPDGRRGEGVETPLIQASGIYSIIRKSPREELLKIRPAETDIRKYLLTINEDIDKNSLSDADKQALVEQWRRAVEESIGVIEEGDAGNAPFFYLLDSGENRCKVCESYFKRGQLVTREEIFKNPSVIPPFHLGCTTKIFPFRGREDSENRIAQENVPFGKKDSLALPDWTMTIKLP
jgi:hypothetical protein